jgi:hypothetical protein
MRRKGSCAGMSAGTARLGSAPRGPLLTLAAPPGRPIRPLAERFQLAVELGIDDLFLHLGARQPAAEQEDRGEDG